MADNQGIKITHTVFKNADIDSLHPYLVRCYNELQAGVADKRVREGKEPNPTYLVINTDEPYTDEVVEILKRNGHWG